MQGTITMHVTSPLSNLEGEDGAVGSLAQNKSSVARVVTIDDSLTMARSVKMQRFEGTLTVTGPHVVLVQDSGLLLHETRPKQATRQEVFVADLLKCQGG